MYATSGLLALGAFFTFWLGLRALPAAFGSEKAKESFGFFVMTCFFWIIAALLGIFAYLEYGEAVTPGSDQIVEKVNAVKNEYFHELGQADNQDQVRILQQDTRNKFNTDPIGSHGGVLFADGQMVVSSSFDHYYNTETCKDLAQHDFPGLVKIEVSGIGTFGKIVPDKKSYISGPPVEIRAEQFGRVCEMGSEFKIVWYFEDPDQAEAQ